MVHETALDHQAAEALARYLLGLGLTPEQIISRCATPLAAEGGAGTVPATPSVTRVLNPARAEERDQIASAMLDQGEAILKQPPTFVREAVFSTRPLDQFVEMSRAIYERG